MILKVTNLLSLLFILLFLTNGVFSSELVSRADEQTDTAVGVSVSVVVATLALGCLFFCCILPCICIAAIISLICQLTILGLGIFGFVWLVKFIVHKVPFSKYFEELNKPAGQQMQTV